MRRGTLVYLAYFAICAVVLVATIPVLGTEIFPDANGPVLRMRIKLPIGTRIEETEPQIVQAFQLIKKTAGEKNIAITLGEAQGASTLA